MTWKTVYRLIVGLVLAPFILLVAAFVLVILGGCGPTVTYEEEPYTGQCWKIYSQYVDVTIDNPACDPDTYRICEPLVPGEAKIPPGSNYCASHNHLEVRLCCVIP